MKITRLLFSIALLSVTLVAQGQVKIGDNPTEIHPKALLHMQKPLWGFMPPTIRPLLPIHGNSPTVSLVSVTEQERVPMSGPMR